MYSMMTMYHACTNIVPLFYAPFKGKLDTFMLDFFICVAVSLKACQPGMCGRHGTCLRFGNTHLCMCKPGYRGRHCQSKQLNKNVAKIYLSTALSTNNLKVIVCRLSDMLSCGCVRNNLLLTYLSPFTCWEHGPSTIYCCYFIPGVALLLQFCFHISLTGASGLFPLTLGFRVSVWSYWLGFS